MSVELRPYQIEARALTRETWRRTRGAMVVLPTGTGKTIFGLSLCADARARNHRVLWLAHRTELIEQPFTAMRAVFPDRAIGAGIIQASRNDVTSPMAFASVDSLQGGRLDAYADAGAPTLIVVDEAHHSTSPTQRRILDRFPQAYRLGLTATPERTDGGDLGALWEVAYHLPLWRAMQDGYLCEVEPVVERLPDLDLEQLGGTREDYDDRELGAELMRAGVVEHTVSALEQHARGKHVLCFTATVEQARETAAALTAAGFRARWVSGETSPTERRFVLRSFANGDLDVVCNCAVLTEGTDLPITDCVVVARPTKSKPLYIQMVGRGLRLYPGKERCLVIDIAGASEEHTLVMAPVLLGAEPKRDCPKSPNGKHRWGEKSGLLEEQSCEACGKKRHTKDGERDPLKGLTHERRPPQARWLRVPGIAETAWTCDCGKEGTLFVVQADDGFLPYFVKSGGRKPYPLANTPVPIGLAYGLGADVVRRVPGLMNPRAKWREGSASDKQQAYLARLGQDASGMTAGQAAEAITAAKAVQTLVRLGLGTLR